MSTFAETFTLPDAVESVDFDSLAPRTPGLVAEYFPTETESANPEVLPTPRPWLDIKGSHADVVIGPGRWATRGSGVLFVAGTGAGKSTLAATLAFSFGLGRPALGFEPAHPIRSLIFQAEDDDGDLELMRAGIVAALEPNAAEVEVLRENVLLVTERAKTGLPFLRELLGPMVAKYRPDLVWVNPLSAFFGNDLNDQRTVAEFFRNTLNPILAPVGCSFFGIHHTPKPVAERKEWSGGELAYSGAGSADLANWARDVVTLREVRQGLFEMTATKRWRHLDWRDPEGKLTGTRLIAHGKGSQVWREATPDTLEELGAVPYSDSRLLELVPAKGIDRTELTRAVEERFAISKRSAQSYVAGALRVARHVVNGKAERYALLTERERPRKEVYPESAGGRPVSWVTRKEGDGASDGAVMAQGTLNCANPLLDGGQGDDATTLLRVASSTAPAGVECLK